MDGLHLVPVATGVSDFEAKLFAARLGADGILWQTRGIVDSIYPFGGIDVLVPLDQLEDARRVLATAAESTSADVELVSAMPAGSGAGVLPIAAVTAVGDRRTRWFGIAAAGAVLAMAMVRVLALG